jgi:hypothetical protein
VIKSQWVTTLTNWRTKSKTPALLLPWTHSLMTEAEKAPVMLKTSALKLCSWLPKDSLSKYDTVKPTTSYVHWNFTPHLSVLTCQYIFSPPVVQALVKASWLFVVVVLSSKNSPILKLESTILQVPSFQEGVHCCSPERENVLPSAEYSDAMEAIRVCYAIQNKTQKWKTQKKIICTKMKINWKAEWLQSEKR